MRWQFTGDRPIYAQIVELIELGIITGLYPAGGRLPPVRELAAEASVNPNTMQKALLELERDGLVYTERTTGRFITGDLDKIAAAKEAVAAQKIEAFLAAMRELGYSRGEIVARIQNRQEEENL